MEEDPLDPVSVVYKDITPATPTEKSVMDKSLKSLGSRVAKEADDSIAKIMFGRKPWGGGNAIEFRVEFLKRKPFSVSILPDERIAYDPRSTFISPELKDDIDNYLSNFKLKQGKSSTGINYVDIKLSAPMQRQAMDVLGKLGLDIDDTIKKTTLTKKRVSGGTSKGEVITFKVEFTNMPTFVGAVKVDASDLYKNSPDPDEPGSISLKPGVNTPASDEKGYVIRDKKGNIYKPKTGTPTGFAPVIGGIKSSDPKKMFASLKEITRAKPQIKAGFITSGGSIIDLSKVDYIEQPTKDALMDFLNNLATDELLEDDNNEKDNMKNNKDFKQKISEIAAKIAGVNEKVDADKLELPTAYKTQVNSAISTPSDLAKALLDIIAEIVANEPSMADLEKKSGWNMIMLKLKEISGQKKGEEDVPAVSAEDEKEAGKAGMPALQESFNRINRK